VTNALCIRSKPNDFRDGFVPTFAFCHEGLQLKFIINKKSILKSKSNTWIFFSFMTGIKNKSHLAFTEFHALPLFVTERYIFIPLVNESTSKRLTKKI